MVGCKYLSPNQRSLIVGLLEGGVTLTKIAERLGVHKTTIVRTLRNFWSRGNILNISPTGRKKSASHKYRRYIVRIVFQHPFRCWSEVRKELQGVSLSTFRRLSQGVSTVEGKLSWYGQGSPTTLKSPWFLSIWRHQRRALGSVLGQSH